MRYSSAKDAQTRKSRQAGQRTSSGDRICVPEHDLREGRKEMLPEGLVTLQLLGPDSHIPLFFVLSSLTFYLGGERFWPEFPGCSPSRTKCERNLTQAALPSWQVDVPGEIAEIGRENKQGPVSESAL